MRYLALLVVLLVGSPGAWAEKAKAKESAKVYNRAGERGKVVVKVKAGQVMRIDRKEGRWYKVRVSGRTGWIPRTKVELLGEEEFVRNTRRRPFVDGRSTKRGFGGTTGPDDRIGADAVEGGDDDDKGSGKGGNKGGDDDEGGDDDDDEPTPTKGGGDDDDDDSGDTEGDEPASSDDEGDEIVDDRPKARVKKKVVAYTEADDESEESFDATPSMVLYPTGNKKGGFIEVETEDGDIGFVVASAIEVSEADDDDDDDEGGGKGGSKARQIDVRGRLGVTIIQQGQRSTGAAASTDRPDNYDLSTSAATIALGGAYLRPYKKAYVIGGELAIDIAKAVPGIKVDEMNTTGITVYNINARAMFGKDFKRKSGMIAFGRLGFRYYSYQVGNVGDLTKNTARLPSEIIKTPTIGGALAFPKLTDKIGLRFSVDAVLIGASMQQTKGLEDGQETGVKGLMGGIGFTYRWKPAMDINAAYDLNFMKYNFGAPLASSMRGHMGDSTARTDVFHAVTVGVAKAF